MATWSKIRKQLEQEYICDALKGRVQYFVTRYTKMHDEEGRIAIRVDGEEVFKSCFYDWQEKREQVIKDSAHLMGQGLSYDALFDAFHLETENRGGYSHSGFYSAFQFYQNSSIEESLSAPEPMVRLFAVLDRRIGKRRLQMLRTEAASQPEWLRYFYQLRLEAEGFVLPNA